MKINNNLKFFIENIRNVSVAVGIYAVSVPAVHAVEGARAIGTSAGASLEEAVVTLFEDVCLGQGRDFDRISRLAEADQWPTVPEEQARSLFWGIQPHEVRAWRPLKEDNIWIVASRGSPRIPGALIARFEVGEEIVGPPAGSGKSPVTSGPDEAMEIARHNAVDACEVRFAGGEPEQVTALLQGLSVNDRIAGEPDLSRPRIGEGKREGEVWQTETWLTESRRSPLMSFSYDPDSGDRETLDRVIRGGRSYLYAPGTD